MHNPDVEGMEWRREYYGVLQVKGCILAVVVCAKNIASGQWIVAIQKSLPFLEMGDRSQPLEGLVHKTVADTSIA
jgi:hypothetical protein